MAIFRIAASLAGRGAMIAGARGAALAVRIAPKVSRRLIRFIMVTGPFDDIAAAFDHLGLNIGGKPGRAPGPVSGLGPIGTKPIALVSLERSAERLKRQIVTNLSGHPVAPLTGNWRRAMMAMSIYTLESARFRGTGIGVIAGIPMPERAELDIDPKDPYYYPFAVEYGHPHAPAKMPIRLAVNQLAASEQRKIGREIGKQIEKVWATKTRGAKRAYDPNKWIDVEGEMYQKWELLRELTPEGWAKAEWIELEGEMYERWEIERL